MPFKLSVNGLDSLCVDSFPPNHYSVGVRGCLLYAATYRPDDFPSDDARFCAKRLKELLCSPPGAISTRSIVKVAASCERGLTKADAVETVAYTVGKELLVALGAVKSSRRTEFLQRLGRLPGNDLELVFQVARCSKQDDSYQAFVQMHLTNDKLGGEADIQLLL